MIGHETSAETFNPVLVDFYRTVGYLPDALLNYLLLLGWSLDDKTEQFTRDEMIAAFFARAGQQGAGQLRPAETLGVPAARYAGADRGRKGRDDASLCACKPDGSPNRYADGSDG